MATLYLPTGEVREVAPRQGNALTLAEALEWVGRFIEIVPRPLWASDLAFWDQHVVLCDEEGRLKPGAAVNVRASALCEQRLFGAVLVLSTQEWGAALHAPETGEGTSEGSDAVDGALSPLPFSVAMLLLVNGWETLALEGQTQIAVALGGAASGQAEPHKTSQR